MIVQDINFNVDATATWPEVATDLSPDHRVRVSQTAGRWNANPGNETWAGGVDADGHRDHVAREGYILTGAPEGALVGQIVRSGGAEVLVGPFLIGRDAQIPPVPAGETGRLRLSINDDMDELYGEGCGDNTGALDVRVRLRTETAIPKLIHFIWAGGARLMPPGNIAVVQEWAEKNLDFTVWFWVDETVTPTVDQYDGLPTVRILFKDITTEGVVTPHVRYEIDRLRPNFGASSDVLRYNILDRFGGAYFDTDVRPGVRTLNGAGLFDHPDALFDHPDGAFVNPGPADELLLLDNNSQKKGLVGNDTFISAAGHPRMHETAELAQFNYIRTFPPVAGDRVYGYDVPSYRQNSTIYRTGPMAVSHVFYEAGELPQDPPGTQWGGTVIQVPLREMLDGTTQVNQVFRRYWIPTFYVAPLDQNQGNWLNVPLKKTPNLGTAFAIVVENVRFEAESMGLLRLDDHVRDISLSRERLVTEAGDPDKGEVSVADQLVQRLKSTGLVRDNLYSMQLMSRFGSIRRFYYDLDLDEPDDQRTVQYTRPGGQDVGPRSVPGTLDLFKKKAEGMSGLNHLEMGVHFLNLAVRRSMIRVGKFKTLHPVRPADADPGFEELREEVAALETLQKTLRTVFVNADFADLEVREIAQKALSDLDRALVTLQKQSNYDDPAPPLDSTWRLENLAF